MTVVICKQAKNIITWTETLRFVSKYLSYMYFIQLMYLNYELCCLAFLHDFVLFLFYRNYSDKSSDLAHKCDSYFKFCDKTFQIAVEHRYAHEYGEVPVTIPTAPITPRSGRPNSARKIVPKVDTFSNPKDLFDKALQSSSVASSVNSSGVMRQDSANKTAKPVATSAATYSNPKDLFEQALKSSATNSNSSNSRIVNGISPVQDLSKRYCIILWVQV